MEGVRAILLFLSSGISDRYGFSENLNASKSEETDGSLCFRGGVAGGTLGAFRLRALLVVVGS